MQLLLRRQAGQLGESEWQAFLALQSHEEDFRKQVEKNEDGLTTWQTVELMSRAAAKYSGGREPLALVQSITARVSE